MSEYVKDLSVILAVDWCAPLALLLQGCTNLACRSTSRALDCLVTFLSAMCALAEHEGLMQ